MGDATPREKQALYSGFGNGLSRAFELAATPGIFAGLGYLLDRWLGLFPVFTLGLFVFAVVGMFFRMWFAYDAEMAEQERDAVWARKPRPRPHTGGTA